MNATLGGAGAEVCTTPGELVSAKPGLQGKLSRGDVEEHAGNRFR